ncbi:hypothetical protein LTR56_014508 [Elasticomyces elasticus]|nr:hypothetical protein LTR56_014508 [Elasticomyces elasticus]KAK3667707.1 hypothetical protein LTR22_001522 [Elasticomyces elasticus]KAK4920799.1 hypothetical protein LTR49_011702 [Elasticomyces elasticus]
MPSPVDYAALPTTTQEAMRLIQPAMRDAKDGKAVEAIKGFLEAGQVLCATLSKAEPNALRKLEAKCAKRDSRVQELESKLQAKDNELAERNSTLTSLRVGVFELNEELAAKREALCTKDLELEIKSAKLRVVDGELRDTKARAERAGIIVILTQAGYRPYAVTVRYTQYLSAVITSYALLTNQYSTTLRVKRLGPGWGLEGEFMDHDEGIYPAPQPPGGGELQQVHYEVTKVSTWSTKRPWDEENALGAVKRTRA